MKRCRDERHPGDDLRLRFDIARRQKLCVGKSPGKIIENTGYFRQGAAVFEHERGHLTFRIDRAELRQAMLLLRG